MKKKKKKIAQKDEKDERCPLCIILDGFKDKMEGYSDIIDHFSKAKMEVFEGIKKIVNREIELKKKKKRKKDFSKVNIDDS